MSSTFHIDFKNRIDPPTHVMGKIMKINQTNRLCVELSEDTLRRLLAANQVCAADLICLDCASQQCLRRLCLESCSRKSITAERTASGAMVPWPGHLFTRPGKPSDHSNIRLLPRPKQAELWKKRILA
jgi:hypothetical protein